ncbi:MAG: hypothetical protein E6R04_01205 [Spirochaetes bacterium]|nr:MAG: hypothetical protein E6R04_01205 [Spirochaetota bacterium]
MTEYKFFNSNNTTKTEPVMVVRNGSNSSKYSLDNFIVSLADRKAHEYNVSVTVLKNGEAFYKTTKSR